MAVSGTLPILPSGWDGGSGEDLLGGAGGKRSGWGAGAEGGAGSGDVGAGSGLSALMWAVLERRNCAWRDRDVRVLISGVGFRPAVLLGTDLCGCGSGRRVRGWGVGLLCLCG